MKNLILTFLILFSAIVYTTNSESMSRLNPNPPVADPGVLIADNPSWSGLAYNGSPALFGRDAVGTNINYMTDIILTHSTRRVDIKMKGYGDLSFGAWAVSYATRDSNNVGVNTTLAEYQDSGIVVNRKYFKFSGVEYATVTEKNTSSPNYGLEVPSWYIFVTYTFPTKAEYDSFVSGLNNWGGLSLFPSVKTYSNQKFYRR